MCGRGAPRVGLAGRLLVLRRWKVTAIPSRGVCSVLDGYLESGARGAGDRLLRLSGLALAAALSSLAESLAHDEVGVGVVVGGL